MAELADAHDSGSCGATHAGSSPVIRTKMQTNRIAMRFVCILVRITGLEPAWVAPHEPESCASANSAISARLNYYIKCTFKIQ